MPGAGAGCGGFAGGGTAVVEPVERCLLFEPLLQELADLLGDLPGATDAGLLVGRTRGAIDLRGSVSRRRAERLLESELVKGVTLNGEALGDPVIADDPLSNRARLRAR